MNRYSLFSNFVGAYVDEVDRAWVDSCEVEPSTRHDLDLVTEQLCRAAWRTHVARLRERVAVNELPSEEWVGRLAARTVVGE